MTVQVDIIALVFLLVTIILATCLVPMIWQVRKTAQEANALLGELRQGLPPAMRDLRETMERVNRISQNVEKGTDRTENLFDSLEDLTASVQHASNFIRHDIHRFAEIAGCLLVGIKTASKVFFQEPEKEEEAYE